MDNGDGVAMDGGDGTAVYGGDGVDQWRLWCSGGVSRGEAAARPRMTRWTKVAWEDNGGTGQ
jgi:hypothetical protein